MPFLRPVLYTHRTYPGTWKCQYLLDNVLPLADRITPIGLLFLTDRQDIFRSDNKRNGHVLSPVSIECNSKKNKERVNKFIPQYVKGAENMVPGFLITR